MSKVAAIIQARMGSTRLSGKILKEIQGKTVLEHVIDRVKRAKQIDEIIIATTELDRDQVIVEEAIKCGVKYYRGSEDDVLGRYYYAAKEYNVDIIVRITSDCPLIDAEIVDQIVQCYKQHSYDLVTNASSDLTQRTYPRGLDTEVFMFEALEEAFVSACEKHQREHVTPYIYENSQNIYYFKDSTDYSHYRWTLDTIEDFELIEKVYEQLYPCKPNFNFTDILALLERCPDLANINAHIEQKKLK